VVNIIRKKKMPASSQIILPSTTHDPLNLLPVTVTSDPFKGAGYYGFGYGLHTVSYQGTGFKGVISMQATLAATPAEEDWFTVPETTQDNTDSPYTGVSIYNFTGNFVWVRATVTYTIGTINNITYNY
jgi:hypothetical protein